jgi:hypothetical protein
MLKTPTPYLYEHCFTNDCQSRIVIRWFGVTEMYLLSL